MYILRKLMMLVEVYRCLRRPLLQFLFSSSFFLSLFFFQLYGTIRSRIHVPYIYIYVFKIVGAACF